MFLTLRANHHETDKVSFSFPLFRMCFFLVKRFKPFVVLLSLFLLSVLYTLNSFFADYENNVVMLNLFRPKLTENNDAVVDLNKQFLLLRKGFKKTLDQYEASRKNFGKKFHDAVKNASFNNLESNGDILKQHIVCNDDLFFLLIQVHSSPENFMSRQAIRLTWGSMDHFIGNRQENNRGKLR